MSDESLWVSPVFKGLTKPAMILGVAYDYFYLVWLFTMLVFIYSSNLLALLLFFPLHWFGWILCRIDHHIFKLLSIRANLINSTNKTIWGCTSYAPF